MLRSAPLLRLELTRDFRCCGGQTHRHPSLCASAVAIYAARESLREPRGKAVAAALWAAFRARLINISRCASHSEAATSVDSSVCWPKFFAPMNKTKQRVLLRI